MNNEKKIHSITALFDTPDQIINASRKVRDAGYKYFDVNTPYPVHGMDPAMGLKPTRLGFLTLFFGFSGTALILLFMWWTMSVDYPQVIGGKPFFSFPAYVPITFEVTVLLGAVMTVAGMIAVFFNLPRNNHPLHDTEYMAKVSADKYGLVIDAKDPQFDENMSADFLNTLGAYKVEKIYFPEKDEFKLFEPKFLMFLAGVVIITSAVTYFTLNILMYLPPFDFMLEQDKIIPQEKSEFFEDEFGVRNPVQGTVARGFIPYPFKGEPNPVSVLSNPVLPTRDVLELGQKKYLTFCSPCHGNHAEGDSRLRGQFPNPPTLHSARGREMSDGMLYHIITNGQNIMPSYDSQIPRYERWAIVNYIRVLQRAMNATEADIQQVKKESGANVQN